MADEEGGTVVVVTANDIESSKVTDDSANMPTLETISTWSWPEYEVLYDMCGQKARSKRKRSSSADADNQEDKNDGLAPFHVVYHCRKGVPWAERVKVTINSRVLLETLCEFIPDGDFNSLDVDKKPKVWVKDLFHIRKKLQEKYEKLCSNDQEAAAASNNDHGLEGQLRFYIKQFLFFYYDNLSFINIILKVWSCCEEPKKMNPMIPYLTCFISIIISCNKLLRRNKKFYYGLVMGDDKGFYSPY